MKVYKNGIYRMIDAVFYSAKDISKLVFYSAKDISKLMILIDKYSSYI